MRNAKLLTRLLVLDLEAHPPGTPVKQISVETIPAKPRVVQNGLFVPLSPEPEKLELTLARISAVVGEENVGSPEILDTHRPDVSDTEVWGKLDLDCGFRIWKINPKSAIRNPNRPLVFPPSSRSHGSTQELPPHLIALSTAFMAASKPRADHGASGDWWRPNTWDREEWDIELLDALYRIYYDVHLGSMVRARSLRLTRYIELHAASAFSSRRRIHAEELIGACAEYSMPAMALLDRDGVSARHASRRGKAAFRHMSAPKSLRQPGYVIPAR